jgi:hypothetical protein
MAKSTTVTTVSKNKLRMAARISLPTSTRNTYEKLTLIGTADLKLQRLVFNRRVLSLGNDMAAPAFTQLFASRRDKPAAIKQTRTVKRRVVGLRGKMRLRSPLFR